MLFIWELKMLIQKMDRFIVFTMSYSIHTDIWSWQNNLNGGKLPKIVKETLCKFYEFL